MKSGDIVRQTHDGSWNILTSSISRTGIAIINEATYKNFFVEWLDAENPSPYLPKAAGQFASFKPWMVSLYCPREKLFDGE